MPIKAKQVPKERILQFAAAVTPVPSTSQRIGGKTVSPSSTAQQRHDGHMQSISDRDTDSTSSASTRSSSTHSSLDAPTAHSVDRHGTNKLESPPLPHHPSSLPISNAKECVTLHQGKELNVSLHRTNESGSQEIDCRSHPTPANPGHTGGDDDTSTNSKPQELDDVILHTNSESLKIASNSREISNCGPSHATSDPHSSSPLSIARPASADAMHEGSNRHGGGASRSLWSADPKVSTKEEQEFRHLLLLLAQDRKRVLKDASPVSHTAQSASMSSQEAASVTPPRASTLLSSSLTASGSEPSSPLAEHPGFELTTSSPFRAKLANHEKEYSQPRQTATFEQLVDQELLALHEEWLAKDDGTIFVATEQKGAAYARAAERYRNAADNTHRPHAHASGSPERKFHFLLPEETATPGSYRDPLSGSSIRHTREHTHTGTGTHPAHVLAADTAARSKRFEQCVNILERLIVNSAFTAKVYDFLQTHHRTFLQTLPERTGGSYSHRDFELFEQFSHVIESHLFGTLRRRVADFDEEEFFSLLLRAPLRRERSDAESNLGDDAVPQHAPSSPNVDTSNDSLPSVSFSVWEMLLSITRFQSFVELMDSYIREEYGASISIAASPLGTSSSNSRAVHAGGGADVQRAATVGVRGALLLASSSSTVTSTHDLSSSSGVSHGKELQTASTPPPRLLSADVAALSPSGSRVSPASREMASSLPARGSRFVPHAVDGPNRKERRPSGKEIPSTSTRALPLRKKSTTDTELKSTQNGVRERKPSTKLSIPEKSKMRSPSTSSRGKPASGIVPKPSATGTRTHSNKRS